MSPGLFTLVAVFVAAALLRVPIAIAMLGAGFAYLLVTGQDPGIVTDQVMNSLFGSYILLAVPMFILAANIMTIGGISERLWRAADAAVGSLPGGLGHVTVSVSLVFSSMSGSALAAAAATIAPIIPPSIPLVLYALNSNTSVGALFLGGILPGLLMGGLLMLGLVVTALRSDLPRRPTPSLAEVVRAFSGAAIPLTIPVVLLGGIWSGVFTPTEAAAVAAVYALIIGVFVYRAISWRAFWGAMRESMKVSSTIMVLIAGAFMLNYAITAERIDQVLALWIADAGLTPIAFLLIINVVFLGLGCVLDTGTLILVIVPILLPTVHELGIDPVHFGVMVTMNIMIGLITPPFGMLLFTLAKLGEVDLRSVIVEIWPFVLILVVALLIVTLVPGTVLWLPGLFGFS